MKRISLGKRLFYTYTKLIVAFFAVTMVLVSVFIMHFLHDNIIETQMQMADNLTQTIGNYFTDINRFSQKLTNSEKFKQAAIIDIPNNLDDAIAQSQSLQNIYSESFQMFENGYLLGVYTLNGDYIWLADRIMAGHLLSSPSTYDSYDKYGGPVVYLSKENAFLRNLPNGDLSRYSGEPTLVLARSINRFNYFNYPQAMLEIHVPYGDFLQFVENAVGRTKVDSLSISIVSEDGQALYGSHSCPLSSSGSWEQVDNDMVLTRKLPVAGLVINFMIPLSAYYHQLTALMIVYLVVCLLILGLMILVSYRVSNTITKPIAAMSEQLEGSDMIEHRKLEKVDTEIYELDLMSQAISHLQQRLKETMDQMVKSKTAALQSQLMALQSQMQPHFLHNTLAIISSLSDQGNSEAVSRMCSSLSKMLRYASSENEQGVTLYEEIMFLNSYSNIMQERFPGSQVHVDIPFDMMNICTPKMILQPLCENSYKYCDRQNARIQIRGWTEDNRWFIKVSDNGPGFSPEKIKEIMDQCHAVEKGENALTKSIDGMGLVNIYARLFLLYKEMYVFHIDPTEGVVIGGERNELEK